MKFSKINSSTSRETATGVKSDRLQQLVLSIAIGVLVFIVMVSIRDALRLYNNAIDSQRLAIKNAGDEIEHLLKSSQDQLTLMSVVLAHPAQHSAEEYKLINKATVYSDIDKFHLRYGMEGARASISGYGNPSQFTSEKLSLMLDVAELVRFFKTVHNQIGNLQWLYFVSREEFILLYPETTEREYIFDNSTMAQDFYTLTLPSVNPGRRLQATRVYEDEAGAGRMVTLSQPVYREGEYMGAMALDLTLHQIESLLAKYHPKDTVFVLQNQYEELLAQVGTGEGFSGIGKDSKGVISSVLPVAPFNWKLQSVRPITSVYISILVDMAPVLGLLLLLIAFLVILLRGIRANSEVYNSQLKFEQVVNQSVQLMAILDTQGTMLYINDQAVKLGGVPRQDLIGKPFEDGPWWRWSDTLVQFLRDAYPQCRQGLSIHQDVVHYTPDGQPVYVEFSLNPIVNAKGDIEYLVANGMDITDRIKLKESMEKLSKLDMLTNISNRRGASEALEKEIARAQRRHEPLCILLGDIDFFKHVNDTYGHTVGDQVLIEISRLMQLHLRDYDHLGRWGGEEFIVILPGTSFKSAMETAKRLCATISTTEFSPEVSSITMTFGVAAYREDMDFGTLVKRADDALYEGKRRGRNRAVGANPRAEEGFVP